MHPALESVDKVGELVQRQDDGLPYDYATLFPVDGFFAKRASQKRLGLLKRIDDPLRALLWPGERVVYLTSGVLFSFWESYFFGLPMYYLNRRALVLTTERLVLIQIDSRRKPRELRDQLPLRAIARFGRTFLGNTTIKLKAGKSYSVAYVPRRDRAAVVGLGQRHQATATRDSTADRIEHLCPHCYVAVPGYPLQCPNCRGAFKSATKAGLLSLVFPGLGDIYIGHWRFAVLEILVAGFIWLAVLASLSEGNTDGGSVVASALFIVIFIHGADAISTWYVARKGHHPDHSE